MLHGMGIFTKPCNPLFMSPFSHQYNNVGKESIHSAHLGYIISHTKIVSDFAPGPHMKILVLDGTFPPNISWSIYFFNHLPSGKLTWQAGKSPFFNRDFPSSSSVQFLASHVSSQRVEFLCPTWVILGRPKGLGPNTNLFSFLDLEKQLPSPKLTANAPENGWWEYFLVSF